MHRGHDHHHHDEGSASHPAGLGHNGAGGPRAAQWQTPHREHQNAAETHDPKIDLDLVEAAFAEGFMDASDPTSFLRLAHVRFEGIASDGAKLALLRVEVDAVADVGSVSPHLGGGTFRYDPLPAKLVSRRKRLRFVYFDGQGLRQLALADVIALASA
jgi:hypothetical protein